MGLGHSPQIVTSGLQIFFDAGNEKSYTYGVNRLLSSSNLSSSWYSNGTLTRTANAGVAPDGSTTAYKMEMSQSLSGIYQYINISAGDTYTYSVYLKYLDGDPVIKFGSDSASYLASINANIVDGSTSINSGTPSNIGSIYVGNGWYRFYFSLTAATTGSVPIIIYSANSNRRSFLSWGPQIEKGISVSTYVPTSSFSTSWIDLVGGKVATLTNGAALSYNKMTFNGTNAIASFNISGIDFSSAQTIIMVLMPNENDGNRRNPYNHEYAGYGTITHEIAGNFNYYHGISGGDGAIYQGTTSNMTVAQNEIAMIAVSRGASGVKWYKNGVLDTTATNSYLSAVSLVSTAQIGYGYAGAYSGDIYLLMMYNTQLSDLEILQNFNALRGKYSL